jgi:thiol-disulfide isomerase/thioredoxin
MMMQFRNHIYFGRSHATLVAVLLLAACSGSGNADGDTAQVATPDGGAIAAGVDGHPVRVSQGEEIKLADYANPGEYTVFDFMSDYCPPCKRIAPWMDRLNAERPGVTVVKVDINRPGVRGIDWKSPVAAQFGLSSIPHFKVMDSEGTVVAEGDKAWEMLVAWLKELAPAEQSGQS